jgi:hypothetical protein
LNISCFSNNQISGTETSNVKLTLNLIYYSKQQRGGGNFPVYIGAYHQRGHGIGNILGNFFRRIISTLKTFAPHAMRAGAEIFDDVSKGKPLKDTAFKHVPDAKSGFVFNKNSQSGSGLRRRRTYRKKNNKSVKRVKRYTFS